MTLRPALPTALLVALALGGARAAEDQSRVISPAPAALDALSRFANVLDVLQKHYVNPSSIGSNVHTTAALREFLHSLDPETDLLTPDEAPAAKIPAAADTKLGDIGLALAVRGDAPTVIAARDGAPAQNAGLLAGDQIVEIDNKPIGRARPALLDAALRGEIGSKLALTVRDPATLKTRTVSVERAARQAQRAASLKFLGQGVAYFRVAELTAPVVEQLHAEVAQAIKQRARGLILDLRNNPGGAFDATLVAAKLFVPADAEVVSLEYGNRAFRTTFVSDAGDKFPAPVVLLVNGGTAAEAEIFAAALRDHKRARLVGSKTFGRGRLVAQFPLADGSALSIPTATYLPPSKQTFDATGLTPDVVVELPRQVERALASAGFGLFDWVHDRREVLAADLPLARALDLLSK